MTVAIQIADAQARLAELVALAEAGETVVLLRGDRPAIRFAPVEPRVGADSLVDEILKLRASGGVKPVTAEEILAWRHEEHRY